ncbi:MAG: polysaccharide biosynthesis/export family protein, partial [Pseudomonadota bacterium]
MKPDRIRGASLSRWLFALALGLSGSVAGAQTAAYRVNPGDSLKIDVWNEESLSRRVLVRPDGIISLPMAGEIDTSGQTPAAVADRVAEALSEFMKDRPRVVVSLAEAGG